MMRYKQDGWRLLAMHDPAGRRGLWYRAARTELAPGNFRIDSIELCAGREGDDAYWRTFFSPQVDQKSLHELLEVLEFGLGPLWMAPRDEPGPLLECSGPDVNGHFTVTCADHGLIRSGTPDPAWWTADHLAAVHGAKIGPASKVATP